jgi:hypothetical protein
LPQSTARHSVRVGHSVTAEPLSEVLRLAGVEYRVVRVVRETHARAIWQLSEEVAPQPLRVTAGREREQARVEHVTNIEGQRTRKI